MADYIISGYTLFITAAGLVLMGAAAAAVFYRQREKRLLVRLSVMLDKAVAGTFEEGNFDETMLSALEARLARFLGASRSASRSLEKDQNRIKTLISDISHQTKTPVANLVLYTDLLKERVLPDDSRELVCALQAQVQKLRFLIENLVKLSRLENGILQLRPEPGMVMELMESVCQQMRQKAAEKEITLSILSGDAGAWFDRKWTGEALMNLVDNAVKYTGFGGKVWISAESFEMFVRIDVGDNGTGIREEEQAKIFERFYRGEDAVSQEGVGIGLYLAREIVSAEGGYIRVRSEAGKGSIFSMYLPRVKR